MTDMAATDILSYSDSSNASDELVAAKPVKTNKNNN